MDTLKVKLTKDFRKQKAGEIVELPKDVAQGLIDAGTAEELATEDTVREEIAKVIGDLKGTIKNVLTDAVKEATAEIGKSAKGPVISGVHDNALDDPKRGFKHAGDFMKSVYQAATKPSELDPRLKAILGQAETDATAGGFLVPPEFATTLIERNLMQPTSILSMCDRYLVRGNSVTITGFIDAVKSTAAQQYGGAVPYWIAEGAAPTASNLNFRQINLLLNDLGCVVYATNDFLEDAIINAGQKITEKATYALEDTLLEAVIIGNGIGKPLGGFASPCLRSITIETGQTLALGAVVLQNIVKMWAAMPSHLRAGAVWLINPDIEPVLAQLTYNKEVAGGFAPAYMQPGGLSGVPYATLQGRPVIVTDHCPAAGTVGDIALANFSQYALALKASGVTSAVSIHVQFLTNQTAFRYVLRADGKPTWNTYLTPLKGTTYMSPFVALAART